MSSSSNNLDGAMARDGKQLPHANACATFPVFIFFSFVVFPLWLFVLLPITLVWNILAYPFAFCLAGKKGVSLSAYGEDVTASKDVIPKSQRKYDLVVFGATGFTGRLAARYLTTTYGDRIKWALAGRNQQVLEAVRQDLATLDEKVKSIPLLIADSSNPESLVALVQSTRCIISTVGPFVRYGTPLVEAAAVHGTDYCDITGETDWVRTMIDRYDNVAKASGAKIVHFAGHDCIPWDLVIMKIANQLKSKYGESLVDIKCWDEICGSASGGTLETIFESLNNRVKVKTQLAFDPLVKDNQGGKSESKTTVNNQTIMSYRADALKDSGSWVGNFIMAMVMANCVKRSNALNHYSGSGTLNYYEAKVYPNFMAGVIENVSMLVFGTMFVFPPLEWILRAMVLPKPGEGPSVADMDKGFLRVTASGQGSKGSKVNASLYFPTDPGYRDTARMLVESGLALALEGDKIKCGGGNGSIGGVYTPAACQGDVLLNRLLATGCLFEMSG